MIIFTGIVLDASLIVDLSDTFNGLMAIPNLIGVLALSGTVTAITKNYCDRKFKNKPIESVYERYYRISRCKGVDKVIPLENESDLKLFLEMSSNIDIRFVGDDYRGKDFTGKDVCERKGIKIYYNDRQHGLSSTSLRERVKNAE